MRALVSPGISAQRQFAVLAPKNAEIPVSFYEVAADQDRYSSLLSQMQRLRGRVYLEDGALEPWQLTADGRHQLSSDEQSWHILLLEREEVLGCIRYTRHRSSTPFSRLGVAKSALAHCSHWGEKLREAVKRELTQAQRDGIDFGEVGGWALDTRVRGSSAALGLVLGIYSMGQILGEAYVLSTATMRNGSAKILRRLGGSSLSLESEELPTYYDPAYKCDMQVLKFDSRRPNPKFNDGVSDVRDQLQCSTVVRSSTLAERLLHFAPRHPVAAPEFLLEATA